MVFPDKKIFLKPLLIIQLLIAIIGGIVATFAALLSVSPLPLSCLTPVQAAAGAAALVLLFPAQTVWADRS